jgi:hypothetical protein
MGCDQGLVIVAIPGAQPKRLIPLCHEVEYIKKLQCNFDIFLIACAMEREQDSIEQAPMAPRLGGRAIFLTGRHLTGTVPLNALLLPQPPAARAVAEAVEFIHIHEIEANEAHGGLPS